MQAGDKSSGIEMSQHFPSVISREISQDELEDLVLDDIEKNRRTASRTGPEIQTRDRTRARRNTINYSDDASFKAIINDNLKEYWKYHIKKYLNTVFRSLFKRMKLYAYVIPSVFLLLLSGGQFKSTTVVMGLQSDEWFYLLTVVFGCNAIANLFENTLFTTLEFTSYFDYDTIYMLGAVDGPLGYFLTVAVIVNFFDDTKLPETGIGWGAITTCLIAFIFFYFTKSYFLRRYYLRLLKRRLSAKIADIEMWENIISILATTTRIGGIDPVRISRRNTETSPVLGGTDPRGGLFSMNTITDIIGDKEPAEKPDDLSFGFLDSEDDEVYESFWASINQKNRNSIMTGSMTISTIAGPIIIRSRKSAELFAQKLYEYLSKRGTEGLNSSMVGEAIRRSEWIHATEIEETVKSALKLFRVEKEADNIEITDHHIRSVVVYTFKSIKYAAGSFSDLQGLNQSVLTIVNVIFWILMFIVAQLILQLDTTTLLAPMLTLLFGVSFAFATMLSNLFTAVTFVLFLCPYDVGNRVILGYGAGNYAKGNIASISLFYTTMITVYNEKLVIPNHVLFGERIINLAESRNATFELTIEFCADGPLATPKAAIDEFFKRMKKYMLEEKKGEWKSLDVYCIGLDVPHNTVKYLLWVSHEGGWAEVGRTLEARTKLWEKLLETKRAMRIKFMKLVEPLEYSVSNRERDTRKTSMKTTDRLTEQFNADHANDITAHQKENGSTSLPIETNIPSFLRREETVESTHL